MNYFTRSLGADIKVFGRLGFYFGEGVRDLPGRCFQYWALFEIGPWIGGCGVLPVEFYGRHVLQA